MKSIIALLSVLCLVFGFAATGIAAETNSVKSVPSSAVKAQSLININTDDAATLTQLKGVGVKKAEAIVAWRKANGQFKTPEQLTDVKGIGESILKANKDKITL